MLNEEVVLHHLTGLVEHLRAARLDQAEMALDVLAFERLTQPINSNARFGKVNDPSIPFGRQRVHETATHVAACEHAVKRGDLTEALYEAQAASARWTQAMGE
jgi:hypothetical protein